jgi:predicted flap endonuclease-1-like 5' DNA nuclease
VEVPALTPEQRSAALAKAAEARRVRAALKEALRTGARTLADVLADPDEVIAKTKVTDILESLPGVGPVRAARLIASCDISPSRRVRGLGAHQRAALIAALGG